MRDARRVALDALIAFRREGSWPDLYLKKASAPLPREEAALAAALTYGVLENRALLDFWIGACSSVPLRRMTPPVPDILRLALYQLVFMDKVPPSAAVNEAVKQARACANPRAASFCNAVLRALAEKRDALPMPGGPDAERLSVRYSHPAWLVRRLLALLGPEETEAFLRLDNGPAPLTARVNTVRTDDAALLALLGDNASPGRLPHSLSLRRLDAAARRALEEGLLYVQDEASQLCALALGAGPGMRAADLCAAPGGKTLVLAQEMADDGELIACDLYEHRVALVAENAARAGLHIVRARAHDACEVLTEYAGRMDAVLCDVPCSGLGVIRKKPDLRYKDEETLRALPPVQARILRAGAELVAPGGTLVYSTCTVLPEENEAQVRAFLAARPDFALCPFTLPVVGACPGEITLWPQRCGTDGFYIAKLRKRK